MEREGIEMVYGRGEVRTVEEGLSKRGVSRKLFREMGGIEEWKGERRGRERGEEEREEEEEMGKEEMGGGDGSMTVLAIGISDGLKSPLKYLAYSHSRQPILTLLRHACANKKAAWNSWFPSRPFAPIVLAVIMCSFVWVVHRFSIASGCQLSVFQDSQIRL